MGYSVGRVAELAGVSIRTLHHYDEIGLLSPGGRGAAGYRVYETHLGLTEMYVADERFRANYDTLADGLAEFIRDAARANAGDAS